jgi:NADH-quinone oxidoreductase subunit A
MEHLVPPILPVFLLALCVIGLAVGLLIASRIVRPGHPGRVTRMPYESGMDPIHDTRRRFDVRFHLLAIAFLVFDVELLFLYPWAVAFGGMNSGGQSAVGSGRWAVESKEVGELTRGEEGERGTEGDERAANVGSSPTVHTTHRHLIFVGAMTFVALLTLGYVYDWRKGVFQWR